MEAYRGVWATILTRLDFEPNLGSLGPLWPCLLWRITFLHELIIYYILSTDISRMQKGPSDGRNLL